MLRAGHTSTYSEVHTLYPAAWVASCRRRCHQSSFNINRFLHLNKGQKGLADKNNLNNITECLLYTPHEVVLARWNWRFAKRLYARQWSNTGSTWPKMTWVTVELCWYGWSIDKVWLHDWVITVWSWRQYCDVTVVKPVNWKCHVTVVNKAHQLELNVMLPWYPSTRNGLRLDGYAVQV